MSTHRLRPRQARRGASRTKVKVAFVTTDPARDTEPVLRTLPRPLQPRVRRRSPAPIDRIDALGHAHGHRVKKGQKLPDGGYEVTHTTNVTAVHDGRRDLVWTATTSPPTWPPTSASPEGGRMNIRVAFIPSPSQGVWHLGPCRSAPTRWRSSSASSPPSGSGTSAGWPAAAGRRGRRHRALGRPGGPHRCPALPRRHRPRPLLRPGEARRSGRWRSGTAAWASGARSRAALGAWLYCRRHGILLPPAGRRARPGLLLAQVIGRFGNYFNQELFGRPTTLPWGLEIDAAHRPTGFEQFATFHPTFLYEALWNLAAIGPDRVGSTGASGSATDGSSPST